MENNNLCTEQESKERFCPMIMRSCKGPNCMMMDLMTEEFRELQDPKKPANPPVKTAVCLYTCRLKNIPTIKLGELEVPEVPYHEKLDEPY